MVGLMNIIHTSTEAKFFLYRPCDDDLVIVGTAEWMAFILRIDKLFSATDIEDDDGGTSDLVGYR